VIGFALSESSIAQELNLEAPVFVAELPIPVDFTLIQVALLLTNMIEKAS
jgi:hypothetical protein